MRTAGGAYCQGAKDVHIKFIASTLASITKTTGIKQLMTY